MVLQDKYKRANSSRYRATHGGIQSNRQKAKATANQLSVNLLPSTTAITTTTTTTATTTTNEEFPALVHPSTPSQLVHDSAASPSSSPSGPDPFARRVLDSNAHRYLEPEPDPNQESESETDLREFIEKQKKKIANEEERKAEPETEEDVDASFDELYKHSKRATAATGQADHQDQMTNRSGMKNGKPKKVFIQESSSLGLEELDNERKRADASRELIARFTATQLGPASARNTCPSSRSTNTNTKTPKPNTNELVLLDDQDFLDEVLGDSSGTYGKLKRS